MAWLNGQFQKILHVGVNQLTPPHLIERVVFSNWVYSLGNILNFAMAAVNFYHQNYHMLPANGAYLAATTFGYFLNYRRRYLAGRMVFLAVIFGGMFFSGLIQGPVIEIEHFFLPFGILAFNFFGPDERRYSFIFLVLAIFIYIFLLAQSGPLLEIGPGLHVYGPADRWANRLGYVGFYVACLIALSNSFERASKLIDEQRNRLFEDRRLAAFGALVGNVAHEINSPLAALDVQLFHVDTLMRKGELPPAELQARVDRMRKVSRRISVIVRGLKFISGQDPGDTPVVSPIGPLLDSAFDLTRDRMEKEGIRFEVKLGDPSQRLSCRPVALSQVFLNLINNSIDAVEDLPPENKWIEFSCRREGTHISFAITDGGSIRSPEVRASLFRNFYTTKKTGRGTGLGLSISREIVVAHGGTLRFDENSENTRFVVDLQLPREEA